jgi:uncharacterized membrane protein YccC
MPWLLKHVDKILVLLFALIIIGVPLLLDPNPDQLWQTTLLSSLLVVLIYLLFISQVKKWERAIREQAVQEIRRMLRDVVNNKLSVIMINASLAQAISDEDARKLRSVMDTVQTISDDLENLSTDSLDLWHKKYGNQR